VPVLNAKTENSSSTPTIKQATALTGTYAVGTITVTAEDKTSKRVYTVTITEDFKPFATVFNGSAIGESITFKCRIGQMYSSGAIGIDSYLDTAYAGHSVYLDNNAGLSVRESATITGTYQGLIDTEFGQMYHVSVTSIS
jgi:hypothetical protein